MRFVSTAGVIVMLIVTVILVADLSIVRPRPKPEIPPTSETVAVRPVIVVPIIRQPVIVLRPTTPAERQAERLKILKTELQEKRVQAVRIEQKLDQFLKGEEANDAGGVR